MSLDENTGASAEAGRDPVATDSKAEVPPAQTPAEKGPYPPAAARPTQQGPLGIVFDFNLGARVSIPEGKPWRVRLRDLDTGNILFESSAGAAFINSTKRYYVRFGIEVFAEDKIFFQHEYDAANEQVLIQFPVGTLGDIMGWFPYAAKFQENMAVS